MSAQTNQSINKMAGKQSGGLMMMSGDGRIMEANMMSGDGRMVEANMSLPGRITPDLVQWIITDEKVASRWRSLAFRIGLAKFIPELDVGRRGSTHRGARRADKHRLQSLFSVWEKLLPEKYNLHTLKAILASEGLQDMWMWVNMMTQNSPVVQQVSDMIYRNIPPSPASSKMSTHSPTSGYLYSPVPGGKYTPENRSYTNGQFNGKNNSKRTPQHYDVNSTGSTPDSAYIPPERRAGYSMKVAAGGFSNVSAGYNNVSAGYNNSRSPHGPTPNSPYSAFFQRMETPNQHKDSSQQSRGSPTFSNSSIYISSSRDSSRPNSQMSDYYLGDYLSNGGMYKRGISCPNTPIQHRTRRSSSPSGLSQTWVRAPDSRSGGSWIRSADYRGPTRNSSFGGSVRSMRPREKNVFNLLYRPDLIKMSSPVCKYASHEMRNSRPESRTDYAETEDETDRRSDDADTTTSSAKVFVSKKLVIVESVEEKVTSPDKNKSSSRQNGGSPQHNGRKQNGGALYQNGDLHIADSGRYDKQYTLSTSNGKNIQPTLSKDDPLFTELDEIIESCKANEQSSFQKITRSKIEKSSPHKVTASSNFGQNSPLKVTVQSNVINEPIHIYKPQIISFSSSATATTSSGQNKTKIEKNMAANHTNLEQNGAKFKQNGGKFEQSGGKFEQNDAKYEQNGAKFESNGAKIELISDSEIKVLRNEVRLENIHNNGNSSDFQRKGGKNSYSEYFDNLIALIENEVNNL